MGVIANHVSGRHCGWPQRSLSLAWQLLLCTETNSKQVEATVNGQDKVRERFSAAPNAQTHREQRPADDVEAKARKQRRKRHNWDTDPAGML
jgi:hypothetical protein